LAKVEQRQGNLGFYQIQEPSVRVGTLANYAAASFAPPGDGHGSTLVSGSHQNFAAA
jgi:hypothetical protein